MLAECVHIGVRLLNTALHLSAYPSSKAKQEAQRTRSIGLGVMGFDSALHRLEIPYASQEAVAFAGDLAKFVRENAETESFDLLKQASLPRGQFPYGKWKENRKNGSLLAIAPTGGISSLFGVSSGIEPVFGKKIHKESVTINIDTGSRAGSVVKPDDIHWSWHIKHVAAWQKHVDGGISKTVNVPFSATEHTLTESLKQGWKSGLKSV